jgi:hypothetical protein
MKEDLQKEINSWMKPTAIMEHRSVTEQETPLVFGELLLTLRMEVILTVGMKTETIVGSRTFQTMENNTINLTSDGDCYRFKRISIKFETEFFDEYERALDRLIKDQYGEGFINPA